MNSEKFLKVVFFKNVLFFDMNYVGFRVPYSEWENFDYSQLNKFLNRMKETQAKEKREMEKQKNTKSMTKRK